MVVLSSFPQPTEGIRLQQCNTTAYLNNTNLGKGTLYIAESRLSWIGSSGDGFSIDYPNISLHAVSRDLNYFPEECLFLMLDIAIDNHQEDLNIENSDSETTTELRFAPEDRGMLDAMFHALSACQALHPDPEDSFSDEDFYEDADEDVPVDETNSQMANLCIEQNNASGMVANMAVGMVADTTADTTADRAVAEDRVYNAGVGRADMMAETVADRTLEAHTLSSSEYTRTYSYPQDQADNCSDTGCFDDAEN